MSLTLQTLQRLSDLFTSLFQGERHSEIMRQFLIEQDQFSPSALYMHLTSGILSLKEISQYLDNHQVLYTQQEISSIFVNEDMPYNQFLDLILPSSMSSLRQIKISQNSKSNSTINENVDCAFRALLQQELHIARESQIIKDELNNRWDFSVDACYQAMIDKSSKFIDHLQLKKFFHQLNIQVTEDDLLYLLRRIDMDKDGRVSKTDLQVVLEGKKLLQQQSTGQGVKSTGKKKQSSKIKKQKTFEIQQFSPNIEKVSYEKQSHYFDNEIKNVFSGVINDDITELVKLLVNQIDQNVLLEQSKCQLIQFPDFHVEKINIYFKEQISKKEFDEVMLQEFQFEQGQELFEIMDVEKSGLIGYEQIRELFVPQTKYYMNMFLKGECENEFLSEETKEGIKIVLEQIVQLDMEYQQCKQNFFQNKRYSLLSIFEYLTKSGPLSIENLQGLFQKYDFQLTNDEISLLFNKLSNGEEQISMRQFLNELTPVH